MTIKRTELEKIARALRSALSMIEAELEPIEIPPEIQSVVDAKIEKRICLAWDHVVPEGERILRGLCMMDYNTTLARIRRGDDDETALILAGKILGERAKPGRKAARDLDEKKRKVAEDLERYRAKKKKDNPDA